MPKHRLLILFAYTERLKHFFLQVWLMNSHAAAADLHAVEHNVVSFRADLGEFVFIIEQRHIFRFGPREGMMHRVPLVLLRTELQKRKVVNP